MGSTMIRVQSGKYTRAKQLQSSYRQRGVFKSISECYVEVELEDRSMDMIKSVKKGFDRAGSGMRFRL